MSVLGEYNFFFFFSYLKMTEDHQLNITKATKKVCERYQNISEEEKKWQYGHEQYKYFPAD